MTAAIEPLGIDSVFFSVTDLDAAVAFYMRCGFRRKLHLDAKRMAIFALGNDHPGLVLSADGGGTHGHFSVEVRDARAVADALLARGINTRRSETENGTSCEVTDADGNVVGFTDHRHPSAQAQPPAGR